MLCNVMMIKSGLRCFAGEGTEMSRVAGTQPNGPAISLIQEIFVPAPAPGLQRHLFTD